MAAIAFSMPLRAKAIDNVRPSLDSQLAAVTEHLENVKDVAIGLGQSRGIWTASAAVALATYIQEQADAALDVLKQLRA